MLSDAYKSNKNVDIKKMQISSIYSGSGALIYNLKKVTHLRV